MTVSTIVNRLNYTGTGAQTAFTVSFVFLDSADLKVYLGSTLQTIATHYTVTGGNGAAGTVTMLTAPANGVSLVILRDPALTQTTDFRNQGSFRAEVHERAIDRLMIIAQRLSDRVGRAFALSDSDATGVSVTLPTPVAANVVGWNSNATALTNYTPSDLATSIVGAGYNLNTFSGTGAQTAFTLTNNPGNENNTQVYVGGSYQPKSTYTVVGTTLTFAAAPASGTNNIEVVYATAQITNVTTIATDAVNTAAIQALAVTNTKIADGAVTAVKIADGTITAAKLAALSSSIAMSNASVLYANASIAAHATTMNPWSLGNYVTPTGAAVTFTGMAAAPQAGAEVEMFMNAAHIFTHGAVFEVDGNQNYTATIGDRVIIRAKSATVFTVHPRKKSGEALAALDNTFSAYSSVDQTVVANTTTKVTLGTEEFDLSGTFAASRFTPNVSGYYQMNWSALATTNAAGGLVIARLFKNGVAFRDGSRVQVDSANGGSSGSTIMQLNGTTDYVEMFVYVDGVTIVGGVQNTYFSGSRIR